MANIQQGKGNLENLAELAQSLDKIQTQLNEAVLNVDPESSKFTLGVFWRKYKFSIKWSSAIIFPLIIFLWGLINWWVNVEKNFETLMTEIQKVHTFNDQHCKKVETFTNSFEKISDKLSVKNPSDVYNEVILLRRYLEEYLSDIKIIKDEIDKLFILSLIEQYDGKDKNPFIERQIEEFLKINNQIEGGTSENTIINP